MLQAQRRSSTDGSAASAADKACSEALERSAALVFAKLLHCHLHELSESALVDAGADEEVRATEKRSVVVSLSLSLCVSAIKHLC